MPNTQPFPNLDQIKDPEVKAAIRKLWEALYANYPTTAQVAAAFAVASPATQAQVSSLLGLS